MAADRARLKLPGDHARGFTIAEVLVSVALIAVLAAAVVPTVYNQVAKGQAGRIGNNLLSIRTAVDNFYNDIGRYPSSLGQLTNAPASATTSQPPLVGPFYTAAEIAKWRGPYLSKDSIAALATGSNYSITSAFDSVTLAYTGTARTSGIKYMIAYMVGVDTTTAVLIDNAIDDGNTQTGLVRWRLHTGAEQDTLKFLVAPIAP